MIACAWRPVDEGQGTGNEPEHGYRLAGLLAFEDPVRDGVAHAIGACRHAGIHVMMVTGDHPLTARAVAREIGLGGATTPVGGVPSHGPRILTGEAMEALAFGAR